MGLRVLRFRDFSKEGCAGEMGILIAKKEVLRMETIVPIRIVGLVVGCVKIYEHLLVIDYILAPKLYCYQNSALILGTAP